MDTPLNQVFFPASYNDLFATWNRYPEGVLYAGGTDLISKQDKNIISLPTTVICLDKIVELRRITRTEHFLEVGSMVRLNQLFRPGKIVPGIICKCIEKIAGVQLRNIATIGGNICTTTHLNDLPVVLSALDAQYELRKANNAVRWVSASRFHTGNTKILEKYEILTRIRLPLIQWDYSIYKKFASEDNYRDEILVFLAKAQKSVLTDLRVVYKSDTILRNRNSEDELLGKNLPLSRKVVSEFVLHWKEFLKKRPEVSEFSKNALLNNIEENVFILSE